jgi:hypothetical protein
LEISSTGMSGGRWWIAALIDFLEFGEKSDIVEIIFLQVGFHEDPSSCLL